MAISVDWPNRVINIPKADLTLIEGTSYSLDVNWLRLQLKDLEDDPAGMPWLDTHKHTPPVTLSGSTYARFLEIINGYTITFEDGQYGVGLSGANNNIVDVLNRNQVSVVANNSSGLIESDLIEFSQFQNTVTVSAAGSAGTLFPIGTPGSPVNNIADALTIANNRGIKSLTFASSFTIPTGTNLTLFTIKAISPSIVTITFQTGVTVLGAELENATITGYLGSIASITGCHIHDITGESNAVGAEMTITNCLIDGNVILSSGLQGKLNVIDCKSGDAGPMPPELNFNGADVELVARNYSGDIHLHNITQGQNLSMDFISGEMLIESDCTNGTLVIRGSCKVLNESTTLTVLDYTTLSLVEFASFEGKVTLDAANGRSGTGGLIGSAGDPVNNIVDALAIATTRGLKELKIIGTYTIPSGQDLSGLTIAGEGPATSFISFSPNITTNYCEVHDATISGQVANIAEFVNVNIVTLTDVGQLNLHTTFVDCLISSSITFNANRTGGLVFVNCDSAVAGQSTPYIDLAGSVLSVVLRDYIGGIEFRNISNGNVGSIDIGSGQVIFHSTCTDGDFVVRGGTKIVDNSTGTFTVTNETDSWLNPLENYNDYSTLGGALRLIYHLTNNKTITDPTAGTITVYDSDGTTVLYSASLYEDAGGLIPYKGEGAERREKYN